MQCQRSHVYANHFQAISMTDSLSVKKHILWEKNKKENYNKIKTKQNTLKFEILI